MAASAADDPDFGPNVTVFDPSWSVDAINAALQGASNESEFSLNRHAFFFKPGSYGSAAGQDNLLTATGIVNTSVGFDPSHDTNDQERPNFVYALDPGSTLDDSIVVTNHGSEPLTLAVYASDAVTTKSGALDLLPEGEASTDLGAWIHLGTDTVTVPAQESVTVPFTVTVPANATPGDHSAGVVTSLASAADGGVRVVHRLGSRVYARVSGDLAPALTVTGLTVRHVGTVDPVAPGKVELTFTVRNTGNVRLAAHATVTAAGPWGAFAHETPAADLPEVLPGNSIPVTLTVPDVWPMVRGSAGVTLQPFVAVGADPVPVEPVQAEASVWLPPWSQLAVLVLLGGAIWLVVALRRRHKRRLGARIDAAVAAAVDAVRSEQPTGEPQAADASVAPRSGSAP